MLFNFKKFNKKDTKINIVSLTFSIKSYKKIKEKSLDNLTDTAKDFYHLLSEFGKLKKQKKKTDMCGTFQLYFYKNLFDPQKKKKKKKKNHKFFEKFIYFCLAFESYCFHGHA